jgi:hypothetical protein
MRSAATLPPRPCSTRCARTVCPWGQSAQWGEQGVNYDEVQQAFVGFCYGDSTCELLHSA